MASGERRVSHDGVDHQEQSRTSGEGAREQTLVRVGTGMFSMTGSGIKPCNDHLAPSMMSERDLHTIHPSINVNIEVEVFHEPSDADTTIFCRRLRQLKIPRNSLRNRLERGMGDDRARENSCINGITERRVHQPFTSSCTRCSV